MRRWFVAGIVLVVALAACGSGSNAKSGGSTSKVSTLALVTGAADAATQAKTAKLSGEMSLAFGSRRMTVPIQGATDFVNQSAVMRVDMSDLGVPGFSGQIEIRLVDKVMYMNMGALLGSRADSVLHGKDWVSIDLSELGASQGGTQNPADMLQGLRGAGSVHEVGPEDIDGTATTHYRAEIDVQKAIANVPAKYRDLVAKGAQMFGKTYPVDVWIDHDGLPRRFALDLTLPGGKGSVKESIDYSDFGAPVTVEAPPADQVQSMQDFQQVASGV